MLLGVCVSVAISKNILLFHNSYSAKRWGWNKTLMSKDSGYSTLCGVVCVCCCCFTCFDAAMSVAVEKWVIRCALHWLNKRAHTVCAQAHTNHHQQTNIYEIRRRGHSPIQWHCFCSVCRRYNRTETKHMLHNRNKCVILVFEEASWEFETAHTLPLFP